MKAFLVFIVAFGILCTLLFILSIVLMFVYGVSMVYVSGSLTFLLCGIAMIFNYKVLKWTME